MLEKISNLKSFKTSTDEDKKTRKEIFQETGKIILYPTEMSYFDERKGYLIPKGECQRKVFLKFMEIPETNEQSLAFLETMELGKAVEKIIKKELELVGLAEEENFERSFELELEGTDVVISGRKDVVLKDNTTIEIKSTKDSEAGVRMLTEGIYDVQKPQIATYLLEQKMNENDTKLLVFYKGKINLTTIIKEADLNNEGQLVIDGKIQADFNVLSMLNRMYDLEKAIKAQKIPKRDYQLITLNNAQDYYNLGVITKYNLDRLSRGDVEVIEQFACGECPYKTLCRETD